MLNRTGTHPQERICRSPAFLRGNSSTSLKKEKNIYEFVHGGDNDERNFPRVTPPQKETSHSADLFDGGDLSHRGKDIDQWVPS